MKNFLTIVGAGVVVLVIFNFNRIYTKENTLLGRGKPFYCSCLCFQTNFPKT